MRKVIIGGIIGAVIAFAWSFVSWMVLPWHNTGMNAFTNETEVSQTIMRNVPKDGTYVSPHFVNKEGSTEEELQAMAKAPFIFMQVQRKGMDPTMAWPYVFSFLTQFVGAALICALLRVTTLGYGGRLIFTMTIGLIVGILGYVPDWNWFGAGFQFTLVMVADLIVTWFLAGLILAAYVKPAHHERPM
ncbi:hypothetical protein [Candidatus Neptunochlamydia vexilliferae]|uniref:Transmembrane protein n=1 Tax=Candidatus Neptunichlamydia vexilliferae TaxID=1651774 RepID=A0ABS0AYK2_9BACT|nr:hypothetical protein [Candidatus Neptunochlamydia vexilliferae]MBF5058551.1 hypothetical protein [Candidatus Neptunochlamydia vexilliferae]